MCIFISKLKYICFQAEAICNQVNQARRLISNSQRSNKVLYPLAILLL